METEVGVEKNDEGKCEESGCEKSSPSSSSPKYIADPVVYKLVRVEGDGRFVPATDDEVMEVEDFLVDDKTEMHGVADSGKTAECMSKDEGSAIVKLQLESSEGLSHSGNAEADAEKLTSDLETASFYQHDKLPTIDEKHQSEICMQEIVPSFAPIVGGNCKSLSGSAVEFSKPSDGQPETGSSTSAVCNNGKPDFSKLKAEICLDNMSIRELHELFKATFGRETTVKDKMWLKRRIAMGLTNSCDVTATTFTIKDNKLVDKVKEESCKNENDTFAEGSAAEAMNVSSKNSPTNCDSQMEDHEIVSGKRFSDSVGFDFGSEDLNAEQRAAKRVRKPTRRYIEELSEAESRDCSPKVHSSAKNIGLGWTSPKSCPRPVKNVSFNERIMLTRLDSLGGSGVQIPCVSRVRRSRPRKNIKALMRFHPSSVGMEAEVVKKALAVPSSQPDSELIDKVSEFRSPSEQSEPLLTSEAEKDEQCAAMGTVQLGKNLDPKQTDSYDDTSDDNIATVPTAKGGMRRKHHRAWTLVEVMKLVDGVSKCGAGRWSEIKRLAFASYSYRTSVDLKDKWRNLLKASITQTPPDEGMNSRKHAAVPIPAPILLRVRQLAEMHSQVPPNLGSNSLAGVGGRRRNQAGLRSPIHDSQLQGSDHRFGTATQPSLEYHLGQLKAKIAKLRTQLLEPPKGSSGGGEGFEVTKFGHGRVALIGFPSVGKSTLLTMLTGTQSEAASYEFTTLTCIPGIIHYNDTKIQLLDLPGIIEGASEGKGRGRQVIAVAKSSDIVLMVLDASKSEGHRQILTKELEAVGLRLNKRPPQIYFKKKKTGGISFNSTLPLTHVDEKLCYQILHEYKIHNAEVLFREDATVDDLIDVIEGNRKYMKCVYVYNKIDVIGIDDVDKLARQPSSLNLDRLLAKMWEEMGLVRVYTKPQGQQPDFSDPVVLSNDRGGCTVEDFCNHIHRSLVKDVKYVLVWGISARHYPQHCGLGHNLHDEDVVQIVKKKEKEEGGRGRFKSHSTAPARISDREKKAPLKT
ncbi:GAMYB transcription factor [Trema orientale]|uniref:GAMYB transcription factor n=1 Tax=Trema orientale TaxID=63057 RepID=A0A2P5FEJ7_TREOI|nr:GAMYB transcription factor [Trema orientale]